MFRDAIWIQSFAGTLNADSRGNCVRPFNVVRSLTAIHETPFAEILEMPGLQLTAAQVERVRH